MESGFREYFAVKATPNPYLIEILREYGCGCDCASRTELMMADALGFQEKRSCFLRMTHRQKNLPLRQRSGQPST